MTLITECVCQCMVKSHVLCVYVRIVEEGTHSPLMAFKWEDFCIPSSKNRAMDRWKHWLCPFANPSGTFHYLLAICTHMPSTHTSTRLLNFSGLAGVPFPFKCHNVPVF